MMRYSTVWRAKGLTDGDTTLLEMANDLQREANNLLEMAAAGFQLTEPVDDDYALIAIDTDKPELAAQFDCVADEDEVLEDD